MDKAVTEFLEAQKKNTMFSYRTMIQRYLEFTQKDGTELLEAKRQDQNFEVEKSMFTFRTWLLEKDYSETYAKSCVGCVRGFYALLERIRSRNSLRLSTDTEKILERQFTEKILSSLRRSRKHF